MQGSTKQELYLKLPTIRAPSTGALYLGPLVPGKAHANPNLQLLCSCKFTLLMVNLQPVGL